MEAAPPMHSQENPPQAVRESRSYTKTGVFFELLGLVIDVRMRNILNQKSISSVN